MKFGFLIRLVLTCLWVSLSVAAQAQIGPEPGPKAEETKAVDPLGRETPRNTVEGYLKAFAGGNLDRAARYLDLSGEPEDNRRAVASQRAQQLKQLLDRGGYFDDISKLSAAPEGKLDDGLDASSETVGALVAGSQKIPITLKRVDSDVNEGQKIWLFSNDTVKRLPFLVRISREGFLDRNLPDYLQENKFAGVAVGHWLAIGLAIFGSLAVGLTISWTMIYLLRGFVERRAGLSDVVGHGILRSINIPLGVVFGVWLYRAFVLSVGIDVVARDNINWIATILAWFSMAWLGSRIVDAIANAVRHSMSVSSKLNSVAVVMLARRLAKTLVVGIAGITILDILGVDVTTGLAALGIGGIALALGAQKTVENLVGSITVVADKPVRVGDFCRFGTTSGTIEEIGIRSTRVRTLDRTLVTIPNGAFSSMEIENFTLRDQYRLFTTLTLRYETTPDQIRFLLVEIRALLYSYENVDNTPARVRFVNLNAHSVDIDIFAYVKADNYEAFLEVQEDILLRIMDIVKESGAEFAFPSQTVYMAKDSPVSEERAREISELIALKKSEGKLDLPRFSPERIRELDGTIRLEEKPVEEAAEAVAKPKGRGRGRGR